jgi:hypothetical protein
MRERWKAKDTDGNAASNGMPRKVWVNHDDVEGSDRAFDGPETSKSGLQRGVIR